MRTVACLNLAAALLVASAAQAQSPRELLAGTAKVDITPGVPVALEGYSEPHTRISTGVHDRVYARAIAFRSGAKKLVLVSCDLAGFQGVPVSIFQKDLFARFDLAPGELFLSGIHTHSGPMLIINRVYPHPNNFDYTEALKSKLVEVVGAALKAAAPARIGLGAGSSPVAVNRRVPGKPAVTMGRNPDGPVDREVLVLKVARPNGAPVAALWDYACHSRSLRSANKLISGDIFGIAEQFVEKVLGPGVVSPAFAGASGDIDPWYVVPGFSEDPRWPSETELMGTLLGEEVVHVFREIAGPQPGGEIRTRWERLTVPGKTSPKSIEMSAAAVGDAAFLCLDSEALVEIGMSIKAASPFPHTFIITNCNGGTGYLPPARLYPERGYEVEISGYAPEAAGMVVDNAVKLLASLRR
jgi:neutral ceramidase